MTMLRDESFCWGRCPQSPRDLSHSRQNDGARRQIARPPLIPAAESALGLRPRSALSSAQVFPEWITSTSPCNDLSTNGDNPLNFVSHSRGSVHSPSLYPSPIASQSDTNPQSNPGSAPFHATSDVELTWSG
jgi:hypothetical protein